MWEQIWEAVASSGIWAMLFVALFLVQLKDSKARETKYQEIIATLGDKLKIVEDIQEKVTEIKDKVQ